MANLKVWLKQQLRLAEHHDIVGTGSVDEAVGVILVDLRTGCYTSVWARILRCRNDLDYMNESIGFEEGLEIPQYSDMAHHHQLDLLSFINKVRDDATFEHNTLGNPAALRKLGANLSSEVETSSDNNSWFYATMHKNKQHKEEDIRNLGNKAVVIRNIPAHLNLVSTSLISNSAMTIVKRSQNYRTIRGEDVTKSNTPGKAHLKLLSEKLGTWKIKLLARKQDSYREYCKKIAGLPIIHHSMTVAEKKYIEDQKRQFYDECIAERMAANETIGEEFVLYFRKVFRSESVGAFSWPEDPLLTPEDPVLTPKDSLLTRLYRGVMSIGDLLKRGRKQDTPGAQPVQELGEPDVQLDDDDDEDYVDDVEICPIKGEY